MLNMISFLAGLIFILPLSASANPDTQSIQATPSLLKQLKIAPVKHAEIQDSFRLAARVDFDQQHLAKIGATVTGRIVETHVVLGQSVRKGEKLATLHSTELSQAQSAYLKTMSQFQLRQLIAERAKRLLASDIIAAADLQERTSMLNQAEVDLRAATDQLKVLGMSDRDLAKLNQEKKIHSSMPITASIQGTIVERKVTLGEVVQPSDALFTVADLSNIWIVAEIPEQQASWVHQGDEATATISALPDKLFKGKLSYVADLVDPNTRTVTVRMPLPNPQRLIKPNMLASLLIQKPGQKALVVPDSAVLRVDNQDQVFVETGPGQFRLQVVSLGSAKDNLRQVLSGLEADQQIVIEGSFHLNSERKRQELE